MINGIIKRSKGLLKKGLSLSLSAMMICTLLPEAALANEETDQPKTIELAHEDAPEAVKDTDTDEEKAEKAYQQAKSQGKYYTLDAFEGKLSISQADLGTSGKHLKVKLHIPKEYVIEDSIKINGSRTDGEDYSVEYSSDNDCYIAVYNQDDLDTSSDFQMTYSFKVKEGIIPSNQDISVYAEYEYDGKSDTSDKLAFFPLYQEHTVEAKVGSENSVKVAKATKKDDSYVVSKDETVPFAVVFDSGDISKTRKLKEVTVTQNLPVYTNKEGKKVTAGFDVRANDGWHGSPDGKTVSKTYKAADTISLIKKVNEDRLNLSFEGLVLSKDETVQSYSTQLTSDVSIVGLPEEAGKDEQTTKCSDSKEFTLTYDPDSSEDVSNNGEEKPSQDTTEVKKDDTSKAQSSSSSEAVSDAKVAKIEKAQDKIEKLKEDKKKSLMVKYLFVDKTKLADGETIDTIMHDTDRSKIFTTFTVDTPLYKDSDGKYKAAANIPYVNGTAQGEVLDYQFANGNNNGEDIEQGVSFNKKTMIVTMNDMSLQKDKDDFANLQLEIMVPVTQSAKSTMNVHIDNKDPSVILAKGADYSQTAQMFTVPVIKVATKETATKIKKSDLSVKINGSQVDNSKINYDPSTGSISLTGYPAMITDVDVTVSSKTKTTASWADRATGGTEPQDTVAWLAEGTDGDQFWVGRSEDTDVVIGSTVAYTTQPYMYSVGTNYIGEVNGSQIITGTTIGIPKKLFGVDFQWRNANGSSLGSYAGNDGVDYNIALPTYCQHVRDTYHFQRKLSATIRVLNKWTDGNGITYVTLAFQTNPAFSGTGTAGWGQTLGCTFRVAFKSTGSIKIYKSDKDVGNGDTKHYSLKGAKYGVYKEADCSGTPITVLTTDEKGESNEASLQKAGTYYVKEIQAPDGFKLDETIYTAPVAIGKKKIVSSSEERFPAMVIEKTSTNKAIYSELPYYNDLSGYEYTVYSDAECQHTVGKLKYGTILDLRDTGTYYVKETKAPKNYALDKTVHKVVVDRHAINKFTFEDSPKVSDIDVLIKKTDERDGHGLKGAEFNVYYYDKIYDKGYDPLKHGETYQKWWELTSDEKGQVKLDKDHLVQGDSFYTVNGKAVLPLGTIVIKEAQAPYNYEIKESQRVVQITGDGATDTSLQPFSMQTIENIPKIKRITLQKKTANESVTKGLSDYSLKGAVYGLYEDKACTKLIKEYTADTNGIVFKNEEIFVGTYYLKEKKAAPGYALDNEVHELVIDKDATIPVEENPKMAKIDILLKKADDTSSKPLKDAWFEVNYYKGHYKTVDALKGIQSDAQWVLSTDENGQIKLDDAHFIGGSDFYKTSDGKAAIPFGTITIKEIKAPSNYTLDQTVHLIPINDDTSATTELVNTYKTPTYKNSKIPGQMTLVKKSAHNVFTANNDFYSLAGAKFVISRDKAGKDIVKTVTTNKYGETEILKDMKEGTYYAREIQAPEGYKLNSEVKTVELKSGESATFEFEDEPTYSALDIFVKKTNSVDGKPVEGAEYTVQFYGGTKDDKILKTWVFKTDVNGQIKFDADHLVKGDSFYKDANGNPVLPRGTVTIKETKAPDGYKLNDKVYEYTNKDGNGVSAKFETQKLTDTPEFAKVSLKKTSKLPLLTQNNSSYSFEDAEFTIYSDARLTNVIDTLITNAEGNSINEVSLNAGTYYVKETKAPKGFKLDPIAKTIIVDWGESKTIEFKDLPYLPTGNFKFVHKVDAETQKGLGNVEFTVKYYEGNYADGIDPATQGMSPKKTWILKSDQNGDVTLDADHFVSGDPLYTDANGKVYLPLGTATVQETKPVSDRYQTNDTVYTYTIQPDVNGTVPTQVVTQTVENKHKTGRFYIFKNTDKPDLTGSIKGFSVEGAVYGIYTDKACTNKVKELTTSALGNTPVVEMDALKTYYIKEIKAPDNYELDPKVYEVTPDPDKEQYVISTDAVQMGNLKLHKQSGDLSTTKGNSKYTLAGAKFGIYRDITCTLLVDTLTTDENGDTPTKALEVGTYYIREDKAPNGYHSDAEPKKVVVAKDNTINSPAKLTITDKPLYGQLTLEKASADKATTENTDYYSLRGAVYGVYTDKGCTKKINQLATGADGKTETIDLPLGTYYVKEIDAPLGYLIDPTVYTVEATSDPNTEQPVLNTLHVIDQVRKMDISLIKDTKDSSVTNGNNNYSLKGAVYGVYSDTSCKNLVGQLKADTEKDGKYVSNTISVKIGTYYVKEITAPKGYKLSDTVYIVDVKGNGDYKSSTTSYSSDYKDGSTILRSNETDSIKATLTVKDDYQKAKVRVVKKSESPGFTENNPLFSLENAVYGIYSDAKASNKVAQVTTNANGYSNTVELPLGVYYIKEITAPKGFKMDQEIHKLDATTYETAAVATLSDKPDSGTVKIKKVSANANVTTNNEAYSLAGAKFSIYHDKECASWIADMVTDASGNTPTQDIPIGTYYVKETEAPKGFDLSKEVQTVTIGKGETKSLTFTDAPKKGKAYVKKVSSMPTITDQDPLTYSLEGAEYSIYTDKAHTNLVQKLITKANGESETVDIPVGTYYVVETKASKGFSLDKEEKTIVVKENLVSTIHSTEAPGTGKGKLVKQSSNPSATNGNPLYSLSGAIYGIYNKEDCSDPDKVGEFVTDTNGNSSEVELPVGVYFVKEIKAPKGFKKDHTIHNLAVVKDQTSVLKVVDELGQSKVRLNKRSSNPGLTNYNKLYNLSGAVYSVYSDKDCKNAVTTLTTDENGNTETKELSMGRYYIKETKVPDFFTLDTEVHIVDLTDTETTVYVDVSEKPEYTPIDLVLKKIDSTTGQANSMLAGAEFTICFYGAKYDKLPTDTKDLVRTWVLKTDTNGQIKFDKAHFVSGDEFFTDENGKSVLPYGTVVIQETKSPDGYMGDPEAHIIHNYKTELYKFPTVKEEPVKFTLEKKHKGTAILIPNATFRHTNPDGTYEDLTTGSDGKLTIENAKPGIHFVQEVKAPPGYKLNSTKLKVIVSKTGDYYNYGQRRATVRFDANGGSAVSTTITKNSGDEIGSLPTTSLAHYNFLGWYTAKEGGEKIDPDTLMPADDATYYAHWEIQKFHQKVIVQYQNPDGSFTADQMVVDDIRPYGSSFSWSRAADNTYEAASVPSYTVTEAKDTTVRIMRKKVYLTIGAKISGTEWSNTIGLGTFTLTINGQDPKRDITSYTDPILVGSTYVISNIKGNADSSYVKVASGQLSGTINTNTKVLLQFSGKTSTITFDTNGGDTKSTTLTKEYGTTIGTLPTPTRGLYTFQGWYTEKNGGTKITPSTMMPANGTVYHAVWKANTYYVSYDANGGSGAPDKQAFLADSQDPISSVKPTRTGYTFKNWDYQGHKFNPGDRIPTGWGSFTLVAQWNLNTYSIAYDCAGGSISGQKTTYNVNSDAYTLPTPTRTGYTFAGWTGSNGSTPQKSVTIAKGSTGNKSYTANWKANTYTITYNANGGTIQSGSSSATKTFGTKLGNFPSVSRKGYTLKGWYTASSGGSAVDANSNVPAANTTYYAQWTPVGYTISYSNVDSSSGFRTGYTIESANFTLSQPTRTGYAFTGWTGSNGNSPQKSVTITKGTTGNLSYRANWSPISYSVTYDLNGGSISGQTTSYTIESAAFSLPTPTKTGYTFIGWTGSNGSTPQTNVTVGKGSTGSKIYTANWKANTYTITYKNNGGQGADQSQTVTYGTSWAAKGAIFSKTGYTQTSWNTKADGSGTKYTLNLAQTDKQLSNVTLYAQWSPVTYNIFYKFTTTDESFDSSKLRSTYNIETPTFTLPILTRKGYTFLGWTGSNGSTPQKNVTITKGSTGDKSYTDNWSVNSYEVDVNGYLDGAIQGNTRDYATFDVYVNGSIVAQSTTDYCTALPYGSEVEIKNVRPDAGHTYHGAYKYNSSYTSYTSFTVGEDRTCVALNLTSNKYSISYNANGGSGSMSSDTVTFGTGFKVQANKFTRANYTFVGWNSSPDGNGLDFTSRINSTGTWMYVSNITLYAQWKRINYTLTYNANGGTSDKTSQSVAAGSPIGGMATASRSGYQFVGWFTAATGGTQITSSSTISRDTTVYAHWKGNDFTVVYYGVGNDGGSTASSHHVHGTPSRLRANGFTRKGYKFDGWSPSADGPVVYKDQADVSNLVTPQGGTVRLYARWSPKTYKVIYKDAGGGPGEEVYTATYGQTFEVNDGSCLPRSGWKLQYWTTDSEGDNDVFKWTGWTGTWKYDNGERGIQNDTLVLYAVRYRDAVSFKVDATIHVKGAPNWGKAIRSGTISVQVINRTYKKGSYKFNTSIDCTYTGVGHTWGTELNINNEESRSHWLFDLNSNDDLGESYTKKETHTTGPWALEGNSETLHFIIEPHSTPAPNLPKTGKGWVWHQTMGVYLSYYDYVITVPYGIG